MWVYEWRAAHVLPTEIEFLPPVVRTRLTDAWVVRATLPDGKSDVVLWDSEVVGFGLRIRPNGKSWIIGYRPAGSGRAGAFKRMKLASAASVRNLNEARALAKVALGKVARGDDPLAQRAELRRKEKAQLSEILDRYGADLTKRQYVNAATVVANLRGKMASLLSRDVRDITGRELINIVDALEAKGLPGAAADFRARSRAFFSWCLTKKLVETNPLAGYRRERATRADRVARSEHGRALVDEELAKVWLSADPATVSGRLLRFWILTGCRRGEGSGLRWEMVKSAEKKLELPAVFVKQGRGHDVPVSKQLAQLFKTCTRDARSSLIFPSTRTGGVMSGWTKFTKAINEASGVDFNIHDLRRTFRTGLSRLGVELELAELALGHARADLVAIYNRDKQLEKLRPAFQKWSDHVDKIVATEQARRIAEGDGTGVFA